VVFFAYEKSLGDASQFKVYIAILPEFYNTTVFLDICSGTLFTPSRELVKSTWTSSASSSRQTGSPHRCVRRLRAARAARLVGLLLLDDDLLVWAWYLDGEQPLLAVHGE